MFNAIKRGFGYSIGKYIFFFVVTIIIAILSIIFKLDLTSVLRVHALEPDNSIIATQWNNYFKINTSTPSTSTTFYSPKTYIWSEQYSKFNWYMWETSYNLSDRLDIFKDYITSRTYTYITDTNDIKFYISCYANYSNAQIHNTSTLTSGSCIIVPYVPGYSQPTLEESIYGITAKGTLTGNSNTSYVDFGSFYNFTFNSNNSNVYIEFSRVANSSSYYYYFNLTDEFFTHDIDTLDTYLSTLNIRERRNISLTINPSLSRTYNTSIDKINSTLNTYYPFDFFIYQFDGNFAYNTDDHTYYTYSDNTSFDEQRCHIINDSNTCSEDFTFIDYYTFRSGGGDITQNENGNVDVTPSGNSNVDYSSSINAINSNITDPSIDTSGFPSIDVDEEQFLPSQFIDTIINFINGLGEQTCTPLSTSLLGQEITIPCISTVMWVHVPTFEVIYRVLVGGLICYYLYLYNLKTINQCLDPLSDKIEVVEL